MNTTVHHNVYFNVSGVTVVPSNLTWGKIVLGIFLFSNMVVTIFGNMLVLMAVYREKSLKTAFNFFIVNLAVTDIAVATTAMSFYATEKMIGYWPFGPFFCSMWILLDYGMTFASVFTLVAISCDRFWSVYWSLSYRSVNKKKKSVIMLVTVWMTMLVLWVPPLVTDRINNPQPTLVCLWNPAHNRQFVLIIAVFGHHGPCALMLFFYFLVLVSLRRRMKCGLIRSAQVDPSSLSMNDSSQGRSGCRTSVDCIQPSVNESIGDPILKPGQRIQSIDNDSPKPLSSVNMTNLNHRESLNGVLGSETRKQSLLQVPLQTKSFAGKRNSVLRASTAERRTGREMRVFLTLTYIIVGYIMCWVPFHFVFDLTAIQPDLVPATVYDITFWLTYVNSTINPFLYNCSSRDFRRAFRKIMFKSKPGLASRGKAMECTPSV